MTPPCFVGTAGWSLPRDVQDAFPDEGSHLQRYAQRFSACEINSSFHRLHRAAVWQRWADSVPDGFRFSAKLPKAVTHEKRLVDTDCDIDAFLEQAAPLGGKLACLLVQLPPSLAFDERTAAAFLGELRTRWDGSVALEPRHASWFGAAADALLAAHRVARVLADPVRFAAAVAPGGWPQLVYVRLHGSPRMYYSSYEAPVLHALAHRIAMELRAGRELWCIFDNTAASAAAHNALALQAALAREFA
ncbi:DUF72 domain-containing protein [Ramlibacter sp. PS4R-6]|uniref:DUF72 domain-containing protein n=1 Tax=Ramlibacter sp. PS4R-6 TaxID=3133438 RepID=UPI0030B6CB51